MTVLEIPPARAAFSDWSQPARERIAIDDYLAMMDQATLDRLIDSSGKLPKPKTPGRMWKCRMKGLWFLGFYDEALSVQWREVRLV